MLNKLLVCRAWCVTIISCGLLMTPAYAMQPCPVGTDVWHMSSTLIFLGYTGIMLLLTIFILRKGWGSHRGKAKVFFLCLGGFLFIVTAVSSFLLYVYISWTGSCA